MVCTMFKVKVLTCYPNVPFLVLPSDLIHKWHCVLPQPPLLSGLLGTRASRGPRSGPSGAG